MSSEKQPRCSDSLAKFNALASGSERVDVEWFEVRVFASKTLEGTSALVACTNAEPAAKKMLEYSANVDVEACCFVWPDAAQLCVECFNHGVAIRFCGHGLLASAAAWYTGNPTASPLSIRSHGQQYSVSRDANGDLWLTVPRPSCRPIPFSVVAECFNRPAARMAEAGSETDYLILEWPRGFDLAELSVDADRLAATTKRAVIATSREGDAFFYLRYFAPQYGKPEDRVTGSAAAVLADYWNCPSACFEQRSAAGGRIFTRLNEDSVTISGSVAVARCQ